MLRAMFQVGFFELLIVGTIVIVPVILLLIVFLVLNRKK